MFLPLDPNKVGGTSVAPPKLSGDTPVLDTLQPAIPFILGRFRVDKEFAGLSSLDSILSKGFAVHPPLRFENGFNDVTGFTVRTDNEKQ